MNLIRNGGFERGDTEFWSTPHIDNLMVDTDNYKYGTYCGKIISSGGAYHLIQSSDYISVVSGQITSISGWVKSGTTREVALDVLIYDSDHSLIGGELLNSQYMNGNYIELKNQYIIPEGCHYIKIAYAIVYADATEVFYIDSLSIHILSIDSCIDGQIVIHPASTEIVDGDTSANKVDGIQFSTYYADLTVNSADYGGHTLDVSVYELNADNKEIKLGDFTQMDGAGNQRIVLSNAQGKEMYCKYVISAGSEINFSVIAIGKR